MHSLTAKTAERPFSASEGEPNQLFLFHLLALIHTIEQAGQSHFPGKNSPQKEQKSNNKPRWLCKLYQQVYQIKTMRDIIAQF